MCKTPHCGPRYDLLQVAAQKGLSQSGSVEALKKRLISCWLRSATEQDVLYMAQPLETDASHEPVAAAPSAQPTTEYHQPCQTVAETNVSLEPVAAAPSAQPTTEYHQPCQKAAEANVSVEPVAAAPPAQPTPEYGSLDSSIKVNKKSVILQIYGYTYKVAVPKDAPTIKEAVERCEQRKLKAVNKMKSLTGLKRSLGK